MAGPVTLYSELLTTEENELLFSLHSEQSQQCKAIAVVQMFHAHPSPSLWTKFRAGVACFVKDFQRRSYYIQLFDIIAGMLLFEQELYKQFVYKTDSSFFHSFNGDNFMIGLNFADESEASAFCSAVSHKLKHKKVKSDHSEPQHRLAIPTLEIQPASSEQHKHAPEQQYQQESVSKQHQRQQDYAIEQEQRQYHHLEQLQRPQRPQHRVRSQTIVAGPTYMSHDRRKSRRHISRSRGLPEQQQTVSAPKMSKKTRQLAMIGHDPETGEFDHRRVHSQWLKLLDSVGVTIEQLKDPRTALFIAEFVEKHGGIDEANHQLEEATRAPPLSPVRSRTKSVMIRRGKSCRGRGNRPPAQQHPPPPPGAPPPLPSHLNVPTAPPPPPVGGIAPPTEAPMSPVAQPMKGNLLGEIEAGFRLRHVDTSKTLGREKKLTGMAAALADALSNMREVMQPSDDEDDIQEVTNDDTDDWDSN